MLRNNGHELPTCGAIGSTRSHVLCLIRLNTFLSRLSKSFGIRGTALEWVVSYLSNRLQRVSLNGNRSNAFQLKQGVSQGACLGPLLFTLYVSKLPSVVKPRLAWYIFLAEDMQLYLAFKPDYVLSTTEAISVMEVCVREIRAWMLCDKLKINDDKTEVVMIGRR